MKRTFLALSLALLTFPAAAADKAGPAPAAAAPVVADHQPFSGLYIGGAIGAADGKIRDADGFKIPRDGLTASALVGYNYRLPGLVIGGELDLGVTDVSGSSTVDGFKIEGSSKVLGSARLLAGHAVGNTLIYMTGGLAMTNGRVAVDGIGSAERNRINGIVYGAGVESFMFGNIGVRLEALRYDWRGATFSSDEIGTGKIKSDDTHIRAGLIVRL